MSANRPIFTRRSLLAGLGAATIISTQPAFGAPNGAQGKLILVILRGALDGLAAVPRPDDDQLRGLRGGLVPDNALSVGDGFALHPSLQGLHELYSDKEAAIIHAVSGPHRERSHFAAQDLLESGTGRLTMRDGWLNRALQKAGTPLTAVSIGPALPLVLRGDAEAATWSPPALPEVDSDTIGRLQDLYANDPLLGSALSSALALDETASGMDMAGMGRGRGGGEAALLEAAGRLVAGPEGVDIAVVSIGGWDTHAGQNGALNNRLRAFDEALIRMKTAIGEDWGRTTVAIVTEFGRTVRENGSRGTDHGTGGAAFVLGGNVSGGRVLGDWPGTRPADLFENRDLYPANDLRGVFSPILQSHFGLSASDLHSTVFPDSIGTRQIKTLA